MAQPGVETPAIDFVILANHVEAINGLLYISGGAWTDLQRIIQPGQPAPTSHFGVGVSIRVPWTQTNEERKLAMRIEDDDGLNVVTAEVQLNVGRPPTLPRGAEQHAVLGIGGETQFPHSGGYRVVVELDGGTDTKYWPFRIHDIPAGVPGRAR